MPSVSSRRLLTSSMALAMFGTTLHIQTVAAADAEGAAATGRVDTSRLEEVTVTATRRSESSQSVPIAISALTADQLETLNIDDVRSLVQVVPGFLANRTGPYPVYFIRGTGTSGSAPTVEPAVATYIDDVYIPSSIATATSSYNNVSRVEVLKGPQGTLFGRNATAGVVHIITKDPSSEPEFDAELGYANYATSSGAMYMNTPINDRYAVNLAVSGSNQEDGWGRNITTGEDVGLGWSYSARAKLMGEVTDNVTARLSVDFARMRGDLGGNARVAPGTRTVYGFESAPGFFDSNLDSPNYYRNEQYGTSLKVNADLGSLEFVSISAYRRVDGQVYTDQDYGPTRIAYVPQTTQQDTFTQEFQLMSNAGERFNWIVGAYYFDDSGGNMPRTQYGTSVPAPFVFFRAWAEQSTTSYSGFGEAKFEILPRLRLTTGVRYTSDRRSYEGYFVRETSLTNPTPRQPQPGSPQSETWAKTTGRIGLDFSINDDLMVYTAFNRGFRSGTYGLNPGFGVPVDAPVKPEVLDAITAGVKSELLDGRLRVNAEAFYNKYDNLQLQQTSLVGTFTVNAAEATYKGIDIDVAAQITDRFTLVAAASFLDGKYDSYPNGTFNVYNPAGGNCTFRVVPGGPAPCGGLALPPNYDPVTGTWDLKGNDTVQSPDFSSSLTAQYDIDANSGRYGFAVSWYHTASYYADADNGLGQVAPSIRANDRQAPLDLLRASINWTSLTEKWSVSFWGENLTDERYWSHASENAVGLRNNVAAPRTYGVTFGVKM